MKKIKTMNDLQYVIANKCDVWDLQGYRIPFVRFLSMSLLDIINGMNDQLFSYKIEF